MNQKVISTCSNRRAKCVMSKGSAAPRSLFWLMVFYTCFLWGCASTIASASEGMRDAGQPPTCLAMAHIPHEVLHAVHVVRLSIGVFHQCALMSDDTVRCKGTNLFGEVGDGSTERRSYSTSVRSLSGIAEVFVTTAGSTCARGHSGGVWCWGSNSNGQIGNGHASDQTCSSERDMPCRTTPTRVEGIPPAAQLIVGERLVCIVTATNDVWCWGTIWEGSGIRTEYSRPFHLGHFEDMTSFAISVDAPVIVHQDGRVETSVANAPRMIPPGAQFRSSSTGSFCSIMQDRTLRCQGTNHRNMIGLGVVTGDSVTIPHNPGLSCVGDIAMGPFHTCVRLMDGHVQCWGDNGYGQTGEPVRSASVCGFSDGRPARCSLAPTTIPRLERVIGLYLGGFTSCAIRDDQSVWCWGTIGNQSTDTPILVEW